MFHIQWENLETVAYVWVPLYPLITVQTQGSPLVLLFFNVFVHKIVTAAESSS